MNIFFFQTIKKIKKVKNTANGIFLNELIGLNVLSFTQIPEEPKLKINYLGAYPRRYSPQITSSVRPLVSGRKFIFIICVFAVKIRSRASRN